MAIITTENDLLPPGFTVRKVKHRKYVTHANLIQDEQIRQGVSGWSKIAKTRNKHCDRRSALQLAYRTVMSFVNKAPFGYWWSHTEKDFFTTNVPRVLAGLPVVFP